MKKRMQRLSHPPATISSRRLYSATLEIEARNSNGGNASRRNAIALVATRAMAFVFESGSGTFRRLPVVRQVGCSDGRYGHAGCTSWFVTVLDKPALVGFLPNRKARAGCPPGRDHFRVR